MATIDQDLEAALPQIKTGVQNFATLTATQKDNLLKLLAQCVARLIFSRQNHPDDTV